MKLSNMFKRVFDDLSPILDGLVAENWATKGVVTLTAETPMIYAVNRDFQDAFVMAGEVVNVSKVSPMAARRKSRAGNYQTDQSKSTNIAVMMDQHIYSRTYVGKRDIALSFDNLFERFGKPCLKAVTRQIEEVIIGKTMRTCVVNEGVGQLGVSFTTESVAIINERFRLANAGNLTRFAFINGKCETQLLQQKLVVEADKRGDSNALTNAAIGKLFNTYFVPSSVMPFVVNTDDKTATVHATPAVTTTKTQTTFTIDDVTTVPVAGAWLVVEGEGAPHLIKTVTAVGTADADAYVLVVVPAMRSAPVAEKKVTYTTTGTVASITIDGDTTSTYPIGWTEEIGATFAGNMPVPGQIVSFGNDLTFDSMGLPTNVYGALTTDPEAQDTDCVFLSDNLKAEVVAGTAATVIGKGPSGGYGIAMCPEGVTLVNRPLPVVAGVGSESYASDSNISLNVSIDKDYNKGGYIVTFETLCGVTVTDKTLLYPIYN